MDDKAEKMRGATKDPVVALHKYNKLRARHQDQLVFAFEGRDDPIFYSVIAQRVGFHTPYHPLVVDGKDMVLGLRELLKASTEASLGSGVAFFVDADFDGLKHYPSGNDVYCTDTYAIENILTTKATLKELLFHEFKFHDVEREQDLEKALNLFDQCLVSFRDAMADVNKLIYFGRKKSLDTCGVYITSIEDSSDKFFFVDSTTLAVECMCKGDLAKDLVRFSGDFDLTNVEVVRDEFADLSPEAHWRGKFYFSLFIKIAQILVEDRNSSNPKIFSQGKGKVRLNLGSDTSFRVLATLCVIPQSLIQFFAGMPTNALRQI